MLWWPRFAQLCGILAPPKSPNLARPLRLSLSFSPAHLQLILPMIETWKSGLSSVGRTQQSTMAVSWGTAYYERERVWGSLTPRRKNTEGSGQRGGPTKKQATARTVREKPREREVAGKWRAEWSRRIEGSEERWERRNGGGERKRGRQGVACSGKRLQVVLSGPKVHGGGRAGEQVSQACMCLSLTWISFVSRASQWPQVSATPPPPLKHTLPQNRQPMYPAPPPQTFKHTHTHTEPSTHFHGHLKECRDTKFHNAYVILIIIYRPSFFKAFICRFSFCGNTLSCGVYLREKCR